MYFPFPLLAIFISSCWTHHCTLNPITSIYMPTVEVISLAVHTGFPSHVSLPSLIRRMIFLSFDVAFFRRNDSANFREASIGVHPFGFSERISAMIFSFPFRNSPSKAIPLQETSFPASLLSHSCP